MHYDNGTIEVPDSISGKLLRIPLTKMMTNEQVYSWAGARNHARTQKLHYLEHTTRQPRVKIEGSMMTGLVERHKGREKPMISWVDNFLSGLVE